MKVKVERYSISKPFKKGNITYSDRWSLSEAIGALNLGPFGIARNCKEVISYKSKKRLDNYILKNNIDMNEKVEFEVR